jgi:redox-sensing transcriptional repressor
MADALGVSPALVRKDFSVFGLTGNKRGGYKVDDLLQRMNTILGKEDVQKVIIVGCGKIGTALMNYSGFARERICIVAGFDTNPDRLAPNAPIPVLGMDRLGDLLQKEHVQVAIMTVPEGAASSVADLLVAAGIKGILNFTPTILKGTDRMTVHNINIALEIENLFYLVHFTQQGLAQPPPHGQE